MERSAKISLRLVAEEGGMYAFATRTHVGYVRRRNEDAAFAERLVPTAVLIAVADGLGGAPAGDVASRLAIEACAATLRDTARLDDPRAALTEAFEAAERAVREEQRGSRAGMGTTLVAGLIVEAVGADAVQLWLGNIGDSRAYLWRRGALQQLTQDHSWVEERIRAGSLSPSDPEASSMRHLITRSIGGGPAHGGPDIADPLVIVRGDVVLLCTDGLHGEVPNDEIAAAITASADQSTETIADGLVELALGAGGGDNVTVAVAMSERPATSPRVG